MEAVYVENPHNFNVIEPYVIAAKEQLVQEIIIANQCYFYDACSFRKHAHMEHPEYVFDFIKKYDGVIIITRCILMELASHSGILNSEYIEYIKKIHSAGIRVLILYEEDLFDVLNLCFTTSAVINNYLSWAVKTVKRPTSTIASVLKTNRNLLDDIMENNVTDRTLFERFFREVRANKESGDNLGEELITICIHLLANIPENYNYKYVVMTDDKGAIGLINKAAYNVLTHRGVRAFSALSTTRLAQRLYEENMVSQKEQVEKVISVGVIHNMVTIFGSEEFDLEAKEKTMTCRELAEKIVRNKIHINY